ncbi:MAG: PQQ-binding-like beta-propeller repeat protein [Planctomycetes bacterium]|nr:PQQ-binding-like beta-propeller repeat protein [Planctomycetota bacterium]MBL7040639.1 PQQ-binding-like beta-propeller repeat protein [Pirellulaceae bacterium]
MDIYSIGPDREIQSQIEELTNRLAVLQAKEATLRNSCLRWQYAGDGLVSLIKAGGTFFAGGTGVVVGVDGKTGKEVWQGTVTGDAVGLAVSDGRLLVSTNEGPIYCFVLDCNTGRLAFELARNSEFKIVGLETDR